MNLESVYFNNIVELYRHGVSKNSLKVIAFAPINKKKDYSKFVEILQNTDLDNKKKLETIERVIKEIDRTTKDLCNIVRKIYPYDLIIFFENMDCLINLAIPTMYAPYILKARIFFSKKKMARLFLYIISKDAAMYLVNSKREQYIRNNLDSIYHDRPLEALEEIKERLKEKHSDRLLMLYFSIYVNRIGKINE